MLDDLFGPEQFGPPTMGQMQGDLRKRQMLGQMLMRQGMGGVQSSAPGAPVSPLQGIAQLGSAYMGARLMGR